MTGLQFLVVVVVMTFGALVQASVGFGLSLAVAPVLILVNPLLVPGPLLLAAFVLTILVSIRDHQGIDASGIGSMMIGRVVGTVPGVLLIAALPLSQTRLLVGVLVLIAVGMSLAGIRLRQTAPTLFGVGVVSGFMSSTVAIGGPPVALAYQHEEGKRLRGTLAFVFTVGTVISLVGLFFAGRLRVQELMLSAALLPGTFLGFLLSGRLATRLDSGYTRPAVLVVAAATAISVLISALM